MINMNQAYCIVVLQLFLSAVDSEISETPSNGKSSPVQRSFDERKISKRYNAPDFQMCIDNFEIHQDKIIRTQDSRAMGARYINERDVQSREECLRLCCETPDCDVFVFEERSPGSCYLFQCGTPEEFKCKFTKHRNYTSAVLPLNRHMTELESQIKLTKHEHELTNLRQSDSSPTAVVSVTNSEITIPPDRNKETLQLIPVSSTSNSSVINNRRCSRYQFECRASEECIAIYNACDGIPQCSDGSDEAPELGCPAVVTTIMPAERINQGEIPINLGMQKTLDSSSEGLSSQGKHYNQQVTPIDSDQQVRVNKEYNSETWVAPQTTQYRSDIQAHHRHPQQLQLEQQQKQNQELQQQQQQLLERQQPAMQQPQQVIQRQRQQQQLESQHTNDLKNLQRQEQSQQQLTTGGNYMGPSNRIQPQQMLTMSSQVPQQHEQISRTQPMTQPQQPAQIDNLQPPQQLVNQAKLYGREGEGLLYRSQSAGDSMRWPSNNYQPEQTQDNVASYHMPNNGVSQIFSHKGNSLVSQSERNGNQFPDSIPPDFNRYASYFENNQYRMLPHAQQTNWQNGHKSIHDLSPMEESMSGSREGESPVLQPGLSNMGQDYYYEENMRNKLQQQLSQQRGGSPSNLPVAPSANQPIPVQYKDLKNPSQEGLTLDHVNHDSVSTGQGTSVKKASVHHPSSESATTEKSKETKIHHHGHNLHRKIEQLTAEVSLRETTFDGVTMDQSGRPSGAILSLTLGMCVTAVMIILVGCRMRTVRRRMRRGKSAYAHDADFLVNGMYL